MVLGHGHDIETVFEEWYESNKTKKQYQPKMNKGKEKYDRNDDALYLAYFLEDETMGNWKIKLDMML